MQTRASRVLFSKLYRPLSHLADSPISSTPSTTSPLQSPLATHFSSAPNRPLRGDRRRDRSSEDRFGDDGDDRRRGKSYQSPPTQMPNGLLRGEKRPEPSRRSKWPKNRSEDPFPELDNENKEPAISPELDNENEEPTITRRKPPARTLNKPKRGGLKDEGLQTSRRKAIPWYDRPLYTSFTRKGKIYVTREEEICRTEEDAEQFVDALLRSLIFGESQTSEKVEQTDPTASTQIAESDPVVSESSVKDADEIFKKMKQKTRCIPYANAMLQGLFKDDPMSSEGVRLQSAMCRKHGVTQVVVYTAVVEEFCKAERFDDAKRVFRKMQSNEIWPNSFSYMVLIQGLCKGKRLEDSVEFCKEMLDEGLSPNVATFTGLIEGFCTEKGLEEAESVISGLRQRGFVMDEKAVREHLDKKGPLSPMVQEAIFGKKSSQTPL